MSRKASEKERENRDRLFELMREHPDLPVIPMVNGDGIVAENTYSYWQASWGDAEISEYVVGHERVHFCGSGGDKEAVLNDTVGGRDWYDATEDEIRIAYYNLPWTECIVVYIETPEPY